MLDEASLRIAWPMGGWRLGWTWRAGQVALKMLKSCQCGGGRFGRGEAIARAFPHGGQLHPRSKPNPMRPFFRSWPTWPSCSTMPSA